MAQTGLGFDLSEDDLAGYIREVEVEDDQVWVGEGQLDLGAGASGYYLCLETSVVQDAANLFPVFQVIRYDQRVNLIHFNTFISSKIEYNKRSDLHYH